MEVWVGTLETTPLKTWLIIYTELYFLLEKLDQNKINLTLGKDIKTHNIL